MTIHELLALTGLTGSDEIPVWDEEASGEPTKKITAQNFAAAIKTLASLLGTGDVVNDLTNTSTTAPLSANMGRQLGGIALTNGQDLNNFTSTGVYYSATAAVSQSLQNCPARAVFVMKVTVIGENVVMQEINDNNSKNIWSRIFRNNAWEAWYSPSVDGNVGHEVGNQTIAGIQSHINKCGFALVYMADSTYNLEGWSMLISAHYAFTIVCAGKLVYSYSRDSGATWTTNVYTL